MTEQAAPEVILTTEPTPQELAEFQAITDQAAANMPAPVSQPSLFATLGVTITDSAISNVEMAAQLQGAYYEQGYLQVGFGASRIPPNYLVFVQCDVPATMTQYKSEDGFELVFANGDGDPVDPGRLDIQILEVR